MSWNKELARLGDPTDGRVAPVFRAHHAAVALIMIGRGQPLGRYELRNNMSIGEGSARTMLRRLTEADYIAADRKQGQKLTHKGQALFDRMTRDVPLGLFLEIPRLVTHSHAFANLVKGRAQSVSDGIRQRDEAIIQGGYHRAGSTTLVMKQGTLTMPPGDFNVMLEYGNEAALLVESLKPQDGDAMVIGSADDANLAREVSMAAVMTLFEED